MDLFARTGWIKVLLISILILLGIGSLVYNRYLVNKILKQERASVELWAKAIEYNAQPVDQQASARLMDVARELYTNESVPDSLAEMVLEVESLRSSRDFVTNELILDDGNNFQIPAVVVDSNDVPLEYAYPTLDASGEVQSVTIEYGFKNVPEREINSPEKREELVQKLKSTNPPIKIIVGDETRRIAQFVYYGESATVQYLRYFPYIQIVILSLLLGIGYTTYRSITRAEQSNLWVGMAKEAAHQLGTPISSLFGWIQLFKDEYTEDEEAIKIITEIENDVNRLSGVAERFGKIGSEPELKQMEIQPVLEDAVTYLERRLPRLSKAVMVKKSLQANAIVMINPDLFQWAVENLAKNAMDAMKDANGDSYISISSRIEEGFVIIDIEDTGSGIDARSLKSIFKPGYSTKKRGWGLGLSLTKRIIEDYHKGQVFVLRSELGEGTTMRISLTKSKG